MRNALVRAARTFIQSFAGALIGVQATLDVSFARTAATAAIGSGIAALGAFGMNLEPAKPRHRKRRGET